MTARHAAAIDATAADRLRASDLELEFERWYTTYHSRLRNRCRRLLRDDAAAEDIAQETLLRAWKHRHRFTADEQIPPWLWRVASNLCVDVARSRGKLQLVPDLPDDPDPDADPTRNLLIEEERLAVRRALEAVPSRHRDVLYARDVDQQPYETLATKQGLTLEGARALLFRARRSLRDALVAGGGIGIAVPFVFGRRALAWIQRNVPAILQRPALGVEAAAVFTAFSLLATPTASGTEPSAGADHRTGTVTVESPTEHDASTLGDLIDPEAALAALQRSLVTPDGANLDAVTGPAWRARLTIGGRRGSHGSGLVSTDLGLGTEDDPPVLVSRLPSVDAGVLQHPSEAPPSEDAASASEDEGTDVSGSSSRPRLLWVEIEPPSAYR